MYDKTFKTIQHFGPTLKGIQRSLGFEAGELTLLKDRLYFMHCFIPILFEYDLNGTLLSKHKIPCFDGNYLLKNGQYQPDVLSSLRGGVHTETHIVLHHADRSKETSPNTFFIFNVESKNWDKISPVSPGTYIDMKWYRFRVLV